MSLPVPSGEIRLAPGQIVDPGMVLVALDVSVEEAELKAQEAQAALARTVLDRRQNLNHEMATTQEEVDRARADLDIARAQIARTKAIIARKTIRAPFRARVGMADVHPGQYLNEGSLLTTLQGIDDGAHVDFTVAQQVAAGLHEGEPVEVFAGSDASATTAKIVAIDARIDPATRNAVVRARIEGTGNAPSPGSSVRVRSAGGCIAQGRCRSGERAAKRTGRRSCVSSLPRTRTAGFGLMSSRSRAGRWFGDEVVIQAGLAAGEQRRGVGVVQAARGGARGDRRRPRAIARRAASGQSTLSPPSTGTGDRTIHMRSFTDVFIKHPVLAIVVNLVIVLAGWRALTTLAGAAVSEDRELVGDHHDDLLRRERRDRARVPQHADRACRLRDRRRRLRRVHQPCRCEHGDGAFEIEPQQHGGIGRGDGTASTSARRNCRRKPNRRSSKCSARIVPTPPSISVSPPASGPCPPSPTGCCARCSRNSPLCLAFSG